MHATHNAAKCELPYTLKVEGIAYEAWPHKNNKTTKHQLGETQVALFRALGFKHLATELCLILNYDLLFVYLFYLFVSYYFQALQKCS